MDPSRWWTANAACIGKGTLFFAPAGERPPGRRLREARALSICRRCPVLDMCRAWARDHAESGFWGGETDEERVIDRAPPGVRRDRRV